MTRERKLLKKVAQALERVESGEYGWCEETGEAIGVGRLLASNGDLVARSATAPQKIQKMYGD